MKCLLYYNDFCKMMGNQKEMGENLLNSLSVYNVGYQKCEPDYQWGPGVRDHYCIHHILSGSGVYTTGKVSVRLSAGDTFILFPGTELQYQADSEEPWEYCWAGFMGADAASIIWNTDFSRDMPYIPGGRIPEEEIRDGMEQIYLSKGGEAVQPACCIHALRGEAGAGEGRPRYVRGESADLY